MTSTRFIAPWAPTPSEGASGLFAGHLRRFGDQVATVTKDRATLSYVELADRVDDVRSTLGTTRSLVLIETRNDVDSLVAYLASLSGGHVAVLVDGENRGAVERLSATYAPDVVVSGARIDRRRRVSTLQMHDDLALLLSTSGSTGSPKLVRLSYENLQSNAEAIGTYLDIRPTDRAALTLPMHYCYGLSVINSNLARGAAVLLSDHSVLDNCFWETFKEFEATSLHGVPLTFDLLDRAGFDRMHLPSLRYVTQAGGKLSSDRVQHFARLAQHQGWKLFVMYGQTEATARMAYLPPDLVVSNPSAIGVAVPGGSIELAGGESSDVGEIIYRGSNVMLGYAESPEDLASGRTTECLATGDIGRRKNNGLIEIVGRKSRFVKIAGLRIDLDEIERVLSLAGIEAAAVGDDERIHVLANCRRQKTLRALSGLNLPMNALNIAKAFRIPRLSNGKVDYALVARLVSSEAKSRHGSLRDVYRTVLHREVAADDTFVSLGGDSLSYVDVSVEIERLYETIPANWHTMAVAELEKLQPRHSRSTVIETSVVLRAAGVCLVVGSHVGIFNLLGGALLLLMIAGWSFSRFVLDTKNDAISKRIRRSAMLIALPSIVWIGYRALTQSDVGWSNVLLVNNYLGSGSWGYWYIETLMQTLLLLAVLFAVPKVRAWERTSPFVFALAALSGSVMLRWISAVPSGAWERYIVAHMVVWVFFLGWAAHRAESRIQKAIVGLIAVVLTLGYFGNVARETLIIVGVVALMVVPQVRVFRALVPVIGAVSSASLYIYLTHYGTYPPLLQVLPGLATAVVSICIGVLVWWVVNQLTAWVSRASSRRLAGSDGEQQLR